MTLKKKQYKMLSPTLYECAGWQIPKFASNMKYQKMLREVAADEAEIIPYVAPKAQPEPPASIALDDVIAVLDKKYPGFRDECQKCAEVRTRRAHP